MSLGFTTVRGAAHRAPVRCYNVGTESQGFMGAVPPLDLDV